MEDVLCVHGRWIDGICVCDRGYVSEFKNGELYPVYCGKRDEVFVVNLRKGFEPVDFLHYTAIAVTVGLAVGSFLAFAFFWYSLLDSWLLGRKIEKAKKRLQDFKKSMIRRKSTENLNAEIWYPDLTKYKCINDPNFTIEKAMKEREKVLYAKVLYSYKPRDVGELRLHVGDTITNVVRLSKGWCKGKLNGKMGFYPEAYAEMFEPTAEKSKSKSHHSKKESKSSSTRKDESIRSRESPSKTKGKSAMGVGRSGPEEIGNTHEEKSRHKEKYAKEAEEKRGRHEVILKPEERTTRYMEKGFDTISKTRHREKDKHAKSVEITPKSRHREKGEGSTRHKGKGAEAKVRPEVRRESISGLVEKREKHKKREQPSDTSESGGEEIPLLKQSPKDKKKKRPPK